MLVVFGTIFFFHFIKVTPKLKHSKVLKRNFHDTVSNAFSKSMNNIRPRLFLRAVYSSISSIVRTFSPIYLFFMYPVWSALTIEGITH